MDARIGTLNNGSFYAFANGYDQPEVTGTLADVEIALGLHNRPSATDDRFDVTMFFQSPAWDEKSGIFYGDILARSKSEAIDIARRLAREDGHALSGKGRYWFIANTK